MTMYDFEAMPVIDTLASIENALLLAGVRVEASVFETPAGERWDYQGTPESEFSAEVTGRVFGTCLFPGEAHRVMQVNTSRAFRMSQLWCLRGNSHVVLESIFVNGREQLVADGSVPVPVFATNGQLPPAFAMDTLDPNRGEFVLGLRNLATEGEPAICIMVAVGLQDAGLHGASALDALRTLGGKRK